MFSIGAHPQASGAKNILTGLKSGDVAARRFDYTGEIVAKNRVARFSEAEHYPEGQPKPAHGKLETAHLAVCFRGFDSAHADQDLFGTRPGLLDVFHVQYIRTAILFVNYRLQLILSNRFFTLYNKAIEYIL
jgi:hypothetical protein